MYAQLFRTQTVLLAFLHFVFSTNIHGQTLEHSPLDSHQLNLVLEYCETLPNESQLAFAFIDADSTHFWGIQKNGEQLHHIDNKDSLFEIGSITKVFTSVLLAQLATDNRLQLDDAINNHLDFSLKNDTQISFKSLANHTSGLARLPSNLSGSISNPYKNYNAQKLQTYLEQYLQLSPNAGKKSEYSNLGAGLLAYSLSALTDSSYQDLLSHYVFEPYQMQSSNTVQSAVQKQLVAGRGVSGKALDNWEMGALLGASGIFSSVADLSKFVSANFNNKHAALELSRQSTFSDDTVELGLGWHIAQKDGLEWHWHNGGTIGYSSCMIMDTANKKAIVILSNISAFHAQSGELTGLCFELME